MQKIKVLRGCGASGESLVAGETYAVPEEVSEKDAGILVRLGKAEFLIDEAAAQDAADEAKQKGNKKGSDK